MPTRRVRTADVGDSASASARFWFFCCSSKFHWAMPLICAQGDAGKPGHGEVLAEHRARQLGAVCAASKQRGRVRSECLAEERAPTILRRAGTGGVFLPGHELTTFGTNLGRRVS